MHVAGMLHACCMCDACMLHVCCMYAAWILDACMLHVCSMEAAVTLHKGQPMTLMLNNNNKRCAQVIKEYWSVRSVGFEFFLKRSIGL